MFRFYRICSEVRMRTCEISEGKLCKFVFRNLLFFKLQILMSFQRNKNVRTGNIKCFFFVFSYLYGDLRFLYLMVMQLCKHAKKWNILLSMLSYSLLHIYSVKNNNYIFIIHILFKSNNVLF